MQLAPLHSGAQRVRQSGAGLPGRKVSFVRDAGGRVDGAHPGQGARVAGRALFTTLCCSQNIS